MTSDELKDLMTEAVEQVERCLDGLCRLRDKTSEDHDLIYRLLTAQRILRNGLAILMQPSAKLIDAEP